MLLVSTVNVHADTWIACSLRGGDWLNNQCVMPEQLPIIPAPTFQAITELVEPSLGDSLLTMGEDSLNTVLAQYENFELKWRCEFQFDSPVNISAIVRLDGYDIPFYLHNDGTLSTCPDWLYFDTVTPSTIQFVPSMLVSDVFSEYKGWILVAYQIVNHDEPCFYHVFYHWIYIVNHDIPDE